ncbi:molybdenum cofactor synthesis domain [Dehalogenimonas alkenigignens]|uniref:Molybdenum cofactor biosynthesis protein B n=2 Tax=Dehalogenimonas alkenigignens TaxID=1217799 RepID=A0A0W0GIU0_9CHLR|nr:molybdenum cofactor synthesis domain [Dehalogenimonas alkenigignens]
MRLMGHIDHKAEAPKSVGCAVITISDSRTEDTDESGRYLTAALKENGHAVLAYRLLKNDAPAINKAIAGFAGDVSVKVIITTGGTGLSHRDITVETVSGLLDKEIPGFGELFRLLTWESIGTPAIMSRALGGVISGKIILCLPGSINAVKLAAEKIILPELGHLAREAGR